MKVASCLSCFSQKKKSKDTSSSPAHSNEQAEQRLGAGHKPRLTQTVVSGPASSELVLPPHKDLQFAPVDATVVSSQSGPEGGIHVIRSCAPGICVRQRAEGPCKCTACICRTQLSVLALIAAPYLGVISEI
jgi:hypothetical protein